MRLKLCWPLALLCIVTACSTPSPKPAASAKSLADLQREGLRFKNVLGLPEFETTPDAIAATTDKTMGLANAALDAIGRLGPAQVNFANTVGALDDVHFQIGGTMNRFSLIKETSTSAALREVATQTVKTLQEWAVGLDYREDVYQAVKAYADTQPKLRGEDAKLLEETLRDYRRAGLSLPKTQRDEIERLRKELSNVSTDFDSNVTKA